MEGRDENVRPTALHAAQAICAILNLVTFEAVSQNLRESFRIIAASRVAGEVRELPGVSIASAGVAFHMFNAAF
ncbi:MAG: hypothetical protein WB579_16695, partial [Bryobacteraceae bacterium]